MKPNSNSPTESHKTIGVRVPSDFYNRVEAAAQLTGKNKSKFATEALRREIARVFIEENAD